MRPDQLLAHYERVADAPDALPRLRRFVLNLAVSGKLISHDREWKYLAIDECLEPLSDGSFIHQGWSPRCETFPASAPEKWGVLKTTAIQDGFFLDIENKELPERLSPKEKLEVSAGDNLITCAGPRARCGIACSVPRVRSRLIISGKMYRFRANQSLMLTEFLTLFLRSSQSWATIDAMKTGSSESGLNLTKDRFRNLRVGFGSLEEQHRIVAKVDELMALLDRLAATRAAREAARDRLTKASLARLATPDPATFRADARFALETLTPLTTRPDQIKHLRQTILDLAVRGKLVEQDSNDEPAAELLKRMAKEKARLVKAGEIRKERPLPPLINEELTFEVPIGWTWVRLGNLSQFVTSGSRDWAKHYSNDGAIFVRMGNLSKDHYRLRLDHIQRVQPPSDGEGMRTRLESGDVLISITGDVGMLGLVPDDFGEAYINQHTAMVRPMPEMKGRYLPELFRSPFAQDQFNEPQRGIKNSFRLTDVTQFVVPLPPLAEQQRIVAKVDALMALLDRLEASLATATTTRHRLLEALLHEALAAGAPVLDEAAA